MGIPEAGMRGGGQYYILTLSAGRVAARVFSGKRAAQNARRVWGQGVVLTTPQFNKFKYDNPNLNMTGEKYMGTKKYYTTAELAQMFGVTRQRIEQFRRPRQQTYLNRYGVPKTYDYRVLLVSGADYLKGKDIGSKGTVYTEAAVRKLTRYFHREPIRLTEEV